MNIDLILGNSGLLLIFSCDNDIVVIEEKGFILQRCVMCAEKSRDYLPLLSNCLAQYMYMYTYIYVYVYTYICTCVYAYILSVSVFISVFIPVSIPNSSLSLTIYRQLDSVIDTGKENMI